MIRFLIRAFFGDSGVDHPLDFVPLSGDRKAQRKLGAKLAEAKARHGREFHSHTRKPRETPPSRDLADLNKASAAAPHDATVTRIATTKRGEVK